MISLDQRIEKEVAVLGDLTREELADRWVKAYGCPPPKGVKRGLLERVAAWHLQARHFGGLSPTARKAIRDAIRHDKSSESAQVTHRNGGCDAALVIEDGGARQQAWLLRNANVPHAELSPSFGHRSSDLARGSFVSGTAGRMLSMSATMDLSSTARHIAPCRP